jgi:tetratricopeptide (TPR) repeat protein
MITRVPCSTALALALLLSGQPAFAQPPAPADPKLAARAHFDRGVAAFNARRFAEAGEAFDTAYKLSPAYPVLYNIGQVNVALGRSVEAVEAFERYLREGAAIPAERRREVEAELDKQLARVGSVTVRTVPAGAEIRIDARLIGKTPLPGPVRLTAGPHAIQAILAGYTTHIRDIEVAGKSQQDIELALERFTAQAPSTAPINPESAPARVEADFQPPAPAVSSGFSVQRLLGYTALAGGLATATVGGLIAFNGANQANDAKDKLAVAKTVDMWLRDKPDFDEGKRRNQLGWKVAGVGAAVAVGGVVLLATAPETNGGSLALTPMLAAGSGGLVLEGVW